AIEDLVEGDEPIGVEIDETGLPVHKGDEKTASANPSNRKRETAHPETLRVDPTRLSSAYSAAYNGGFVDKHAMPPKKVREYINANMADNSKYAPAALNDHAKQIEAGAYGDDPLSRRSQEKWGSADVRMKTAAALDDFTRGYIEAALWSSNDESDPSGGDPMDKNYDIGDIDKDSLREITQTCQNFQKENQDLLGQAYQRPGYGRPEEYTAEARAGHDFWLTRNGHGAGFWDRRELEEGGLGDQLTEKAKAYGESALYIGDDHRVHVYESDSGPQSNLPLQDGTAAYIASKMAKIVDSDNGYEAMS